MSRLDKIKKEIEKLRGEICFHDYKYYLENQPAISDAQYDGLLQKLIKLEEEYPQFITSDSPTQRVGGMTAKEFEPAQHIVSLLSLANAFSDDELYAFDKRVKKVLGYPPDKDMEYVAELKIDGLAINLTYEKGILTKGATRGDGNIGENVTTNLKTVRSIPLKLYDSVDAPAFIEVRGEVFMEHQDFEKLNKERESSDEPLFANPRNAASGSVRQLDPHITSKRRLKIFVYGVGAVKGITFSEHSEILKYLTKIGLKTNPNTKVCKNIDEAIKFCHSWSQKKKSLPYDIDGIVLKVNNIQEQKKLGEITRSPRWAIAFKFAAVQGNTKIKEIIVQVGRTGALTPVAIMEPTEVGGVTVSRATLHNENEINKKDIRVGDTVVIQRAGDVIPEVVSVAKDKRTGTEKKWTMPQKCPVCKEKVFRPLDEAVWRCTNIACSAQVKERIRHFTSRNAMDIEGIGDAHVHQLVENGLIKDPADLYFLERRDLLPLERMGNKLASNIIKAIEKSKSQDLPRLIYALGIRNVGEHIAEVLTSYYSSLRVLSNVKKEDLETINEIGPTISESIVYFFSQFHNQQVINKLKKAGVNLELKQKPSILKTLSGKTFVLTGTLDEFTRDEASRLVKELGGRISSSVNSQTDYVLAGTSPGSKFDKAKKLGVKIINESEFKKIIGK